MVYGKNGYNGKPDLENGIPQYGSGSTQEIELPTSKHHEKSVDMSAFSNEKVDLLAKILKYLKFQTNRGNNNQNVPNSNIGKKNGVEMDIPEMDGPDQRFYEIYYVKVGGSIGCSVNGKFYPKDTVVPRYNESDTLLRVKKFNGSNTKEVEIYIPNRNVK